jgi:predicted oxidoreductase (fatty acid repression mutant protein)
MLGYGTLRFRDRITYKLTKNLQQEFYYKAVDQVIGDRQKHKGMSWRHQSSRALALLNVLELNGGWHDFWFSSTTN